MTQARPHHLLKQWRIAEGLTLADAAVRVGTSRQVWWGWENGRRPGWQMLERLKKLTGGRVTADAWFSDRAKAA